MAAVIVRLLVLVAVLAGSSCDSDGGDRDGVLAYARAIKPLAQEGGRVVQTGIKPGIGELQRGEIAPQAFRDRAATWRRQMENVRGQFAAVSAPASLADVRRLFDESLRGYIEAIDAFVLASSRPKAEIGAAISAAVPTAENADRVYDRATEALKSHLRRVGLNESEAP